MISAALDSPIPGGRVRTPGRARGFSLIEVAIALFVMALLLGGILAPFGRQVEQRQISETEKTLEEIREALVGFAIANGYLPCPDKTTTSGVGTRNDGIEDVYTTSGTPGTCVATTQGNVPWATLGVGASDVWGNRFRYQVTPAYSQRSPLGTFTLSTAANINVWTSNAMTLRLTAAAPDGAVAVIISLGKNGKGAISAQTGTANPAPTSADEIANQIGPIHFVSRTMTSAGSPAGEFDDIVIWLSKPALINRMVAAGKLP